MVLEDVSSVIDHHLGGMISGKPFVKQYKLIYDKEEETVMFEKNGERVTFKMPHKMEGFKDIEDLNTDNIPPFFVTSKGDEEKGEAFGKHLEEKHVTWARFGEKLDKNITFQAYDFHSDSFNKSAHKVKFLIKFMTSQTVETASEITLDAVMIEERHRHHEM
nr:hypothetical protein [Tanacetum cinerariifolium]